jgi:hypothetical protein
LHLPEAKYRNIKASTFDTDLLKRKPNFFSVTHRDMEIEFSEFILTYFLSIRSLWTHQMIEMKDFARTTICFIRNCTKADSLWRTVVKKSNI